MSDHERIWLEPECCPESDTGRTWCQDGDVWSHDADATIEHQKPTEYVCVGLYEKAQAQLDAVKWQPIETAPKQGAILLWVPENKCTYCAIWSKNGCGYTGWVIFGGEWREHLQRATHWMPLPQALEQE